MNWNQFWRINRNYFYVCGLSILAFILAYLNFLKIWENTVPYAIEVRWCHFRIYFLIILTGQAVLYPSGLSFCWSICSQKMLSTDILREFTNIFFYISLKCLSNLMTQVKSINSTQVSFTSLSKNLTMWQQTLWTRIVKLETYSTMILREMYLPRNQIRYRWKILRSTNPETPNARFFISNCFELPSHLHSQ